MNNHFFTTCFTVALALLTGLSNAHGDGVVRLVENGAAIAEIVVPEKPSSGIKLASEDLQKHLELMSGARLPIVNQPTPGTVNHVYIGESEFTRKLGFQPAKFNNSGFEIVAKDNYVILAGPDILRSPSPYSRSDGIKKWQEFCGEKFGFGAGGDIGIGFGNGQLGIHTNDDTGNWYAVSELLEQLGVRWYMPYENGTVIPEIKTVTVANQHLIREAKFARREFCFYNAMRDDRDGVAWFKRLKQGNHKIIIFNHTTYDIYSSKEQQKLHPEYLACDAAGKPYSGWPPGAGMPRYTDPGFRKAAVTYMNKVFEAIPDLSAMTIGPPDGGVKMDARDLSLYGKATDSEMQKASNYVWDFHVYLARELKKSHPDKHLIYMSGYDANEIPTNIDGVPDNLIFPFDQGYIAFRVLDATDRATIESRHRWLAAMKNAGATKLEKSPVWDYFLYYRTSANPHYPVFFTESLQREMKEMLPYAEGKYIEIQNESYQMPGEKFKREKLAVPGLVHLMVYWQSKLLWDPELDRKKMLEEYYTLFFGPAAAEMKEFHEFAEAVWTRQESRSISAAGLGFLKEKDVDCYFDILKRARDRAGKDSVYDKRIALMETEMQSLKKLFPNLKRSGPDFRAYSTADPITLDGDVDKPLWQPKSILWYGMKELVTGKTPAQNRTRTAIRMPRDKSALFLSVICEESQMDKLRAQTNRPDDVNIFEDDVIEIYLETPERSYFKIVVNANGAIWDESRDVSIIDRDTLPLLWNPGVKAVVKKEKDRWTAEIMIPTKDFGSLGPDKIYPWGINVCRCRFAGGPEEAFAISPTGIPKFLELSKLGNLWLQ
jgi:hypothetical protein